jgi:hypothetical protein
MRRLPARDVQNDGDGLAPQDTDDPVLLAQRYFSDEFPNPEREGCPPSDDQIRLIQAGFAPREQLREHLFQCSACFVEYRNGLLAQRKVQPVSSTSWWPSLLFSLKRRWVLVAACLVLLFVAGIVLRFAMPGTPPNPVAQNRTGSQQPASDSQPDSGPPKMAQPPGSVPSPRSEVIPQLQAKNIVRIDLNQTATVRGADNPAGPATPVRLLRSITSLSITLPEGSRSGIYTVSLVDAFGKELVNHPGLRSNGKQLVATLDLRTVPAMKYRLLVSRNGEAPDYISVEVTNGSPKHHN